MTLSHSTLGFVAALATAAAAAQPAAPERGTDVLKPLVDCVHAAGWSALETTRLPSQLNSRTVATVNGPARVSLADGYRLLLARPGTTTPALNLKIERSRPDRFEADREALRAQMQFFVSRAPGLIPLQQDQWDDVEVLQLRRPPLATTGPAGIAVLINARTQVVASATLLDEASADRGAHEIGRCLSLPLAPTP